MSCADSSVTKNSLQLDLPSSDFKNAKKKSEATAKLNFDMKFSSYDFMRGKEYINIYVNHLSVTYKMTGEQFAK